MKLSTRSRYGTRVMLELGIKYGKGPVMLRDIAANQDISEKYLSQIILILKGAGLVHSMRGMKGGYILARDPKKIDLLKIIEVLEGGLTLVECNKKGEICGRASICVTRELWKSLEETIKNELKKKTLDKLVKQCKEKKISSLDYSI